MVGKEAVGEETLVWWEAVGVETLTRERLFEKRLGRERLLKNGLVLCE